MFSATSLSLCCSILCFSCWEWVPICSVKKWIRWHWNVSILMSDPLHPTPPHLLSYRYWKLCGSHLYLWKEIVSAVLVICELKETPLKCVLSSGNTVICRASLRAKSFLRTKIGCFSLRQWCKVRLLRSRICLRDVHLTNFPQPLESQKRHRWFRVGFAAPHSYG